MTTTAGKHFQYLDMLRERRNMATSINKSFRFFELPRELRNRIYSSLTSDDAQQRRTVITAAMISIEHGPVTEMLLVSRQFRTEYFEEVLLSMEASLVFSVASMAYRFSERRPPGNSMFICPCPSTHIPAVYKNPSSNAADEKWLLSKACNLRIELKVGRDLFGKEHVKYLEKLFSRHSDLFKSVRSVTLLIDTRNYPESARTRLEGRRLDNKSLDFTQFFNMTLPFGTETRRTVWRTRLYTAKGSKAWDNLAARQLEGDCGNWIDYLVSPSTSETSWAGMELEVVGHGACPVAENQDEVD